MSNLLLYYKPNSEKSDTKKFSGFLSKSEFKRRGEFIHKRIALGYSAEEVSFLIGRNKMFIEHYEEMTPGIRPENADIQALSVVFREDMSAIFPPQGDDALKWKLSGTKKEEKGILYYNATLETDENPKPVVTAKERVLKEYENVPIRDHNLAFSVMYRLLEGNYFLSSRSPIEIYTSILNALTIKIRPIALKWEINQMVLRRKLCCFRNPEGKRRYHKYVNSKKYGYEQRP